MFGAWRNLTTIVVVFSCVTLFGCSEEGQLPAHPHATASPQYGPVPVADRAAKPTDMNEGGINVLAPDLEFSGGSESKIASVTIAYDDWNTIIATSRVPVDVGLMLDPGMNAGDVARNRLQYLADRIWLLGITKFDELGIISTREYGDYMLTAAVYNPTGDVDEISSLGIRITSTPPRVTLADHTFYGASHGGCIIPAHTVYFAYLTFTRFVPMPPTATSIAYDFSANGLITCRGLVCPTGVPISLCQE